MLARRWSQRSSTKNKSRTICIGGAACALRIWRKPTSIERKTTKWVVTELVGIGIHIMALTRIFQETESSTAHSVGVSIHRLTWASRRFSSSATTILIGTFVTVAIGTTVGSTVIEGTVIGSALAIGGTAIESTLAIGGTEVRG